MPFPRLGAQCAGCFGGLRKAEGGHGRALKPLGPEALKAQLAGGGAEQQSEPSLGALKLVDPSPLQEQLADSEARLRQAVARSKEDETIIENLKRQANEQAVLVDRFQTSLLAAQAVHRAEVKACLRHWARDVAQLQEQLHQQVAKTIELEVRLSKQEDCYRSVTASSLETATTQADSPSRTISSLSSEANSPLEAGLIGSGDIFDDEDVPRVKPTLRRMRTTYMEELDCPTNPQRLEELAAVSLSQWIYADSVAGQSPEPPSLPHLPFVSVQAHCVSEDVRLGSLKVATATVQFPGGRKSFFVVFKGTSYLLDVVNWNVEHDYKETGDPASFVHKGAAGMVRNLLFLKLESDGSFLAQMQAAYQQGARHMVLTGHSLGGLYAMAMLHAVFKQLNGQGPKLELPPGVRQLLEAARCVTFGAPMCFGSDPGKQQSRHFLNFEAFARERAVNYMNEGDPCPRAWSAVDPRDLMAKAAEVLKRGITVERGSVKGRIASKVVDTAMQGILKRPDFERQIVGCSKDFRHLARIRLLSRQNKPCIHWRSDFQLARQGFDDHPVAKYLERLIEASNAERPSCQIYDDDELGSKITLLHLVG